jgi:pilus assembly protein CpaF
MSDVQQRNQVIAALVDAAAREFPSSSVGDLNVSEEELGAFFRGLLARRPLLSPADADLAIRAAINELLGYGPIQALMDDPEVTDILINGWDHISFEKNGRLFPYDGSFLAPSHLTAFVHRHVARAERAVNRANPWVDVELPDGSRMHVVVTPVALGGPFVSIRRFPPVPLSLLDLEARGGLTAEQRLWLERAVADRLNMIVAGAPGVGKTTLVGALLSLVPPDQRIIMIEDVSELKVDHPHCIKLQTRRIAHGDAEQANIRKLVRETLRMRPDRLVVGEVRGEEVFDMVTAMSIGLAGSLSTLHAGSVTGAINRLESLYASATSGQAAVNPGQALRDAIDAIIFLKRDSSGRRAVVDIKLLRQM